MRGRRRHPKIRVPRSPRRKIDLTDKPKVVFPGFNNRVGVVIAPGPEQSVVRFLDNREDEHLPPEGCYPNTWFQSYRVRLRSERVRLKPERVRLKAERVRL